MTKPTFKPPALDKLSEVDVSDCEYNVECEEIVGIVSQGSQGGWPRSSDYEVHCFSFAAWRRIGGPVINRELTILRPVAPNDWDWSDFPDGSIHRVKLLLSTDETRAVFASKSRLKVTDKELVAIGEELKKPVAVSTSRFGDLILNRKYDWFEGESDWNGKSISLTFHAPNQISLELLLKTADALWEDQVGWKHIIEDFAVKELLPLKNDNWLQDNEEPLTAEQFKAKMSLQSISIFEDGQFEFWHDDGDLFWGHSIQISGSLNEGLTHADIPG